jgi:hypothetical protein
METSPDGGYPIFPIYPTLASIDSKGQCDVGKAVDDNFKKMTALNSADTKCSFSFSATSNKCIIMNIPILSAFVIQIPIIEGMCLYTSKNPAKSSSKIKKATKVIAKIAQVLAAVVEVAVNLFFNNKLVLDPLSMIASFNIENALDLLINLPFDIAGQNWACVAARPSFMQGVQYELQIGIAAATDVQYSKAKNAMKKYRFCGHDWLSYKKTEDEKYWVRGGYENSHYRYVVDSIENGTVKKDIGEQVYREYVYGGREHISYATDREKMLEEGLDSNDNRSKTVNYDINYCIDPRTEEQKGFDGMFQRYYMRGNEKANFACNRFLYDGKSGCFLPESDVAIGDRASITETISGENGKKYYFVKNEKYDKTCVKAFVEARKCCRYRSKHLVCIHDKDKNNIGDGTFCLSNVVNGYGASEAISSNIFTFIQNYDEDKDRVTCTVGEVDFEAGKKKDTDYVCVFSHGLCPYDFKLNAGLNYRASYCDTDYFTDYRDSSSVLQRGANHFNATICKEGLFSEKYRKKYKEMFSSGGKELAAFTYNRVKGDMGGFNNGDFETIYNFDGYTDGDRTVVKEPFMTKFKYSVAESTNRRSCGFSSKDSSDTATKTFAQYDLKQSEVNYMKSSAFGKVKNFCQYRAHCVEVEREEDYDDNYVVGSLFLDSSCNGTTSNSRNILQDDGGGVPRQLSAPIVECIFESLKNLIAGVAGSSLCEASGDLNNMGYCGPDSEATVSAQMAVGNSVFFNGRYKKIDGKFIVKNYELPPNYNPFLKIQKYLIRTIKAALTLFMVIYFYKQLLMGNLENLAKPENMLKMVFPLFKFVVVIWLIFYNGWQQGAYNHIVNFATASYSFMNRMLTKIVKNPKNQMLNFEEDGEVNAVKIVENNSITLEDRDIMLCFKYGLFGDINYSRRNIVTERCERGFYSNYEIDSNWE